MKNLYYQEELKEAEKLLVIQIVSNEARHDLYIKL